MVRRLHQTAHRLDNATTHQRTAASKRWSGVIVALRINARSHLRVCAMVRLHGHTAHRFTIASPRRRDGDHGRVGAMLQHHFRTVQLNTVASAHWCDCIATLPTNALPHQRNDAMIPKHYRTAHHFTLASTRRCECSYRSYQSDDATALS